jgi:hypothetical protein
VKDGDKLGMKKFAVWIRATVYADARIRDRDEENQDCRLVSPWFPWLAYKAP